MLRRGSFRRSHAAAASALALLSALVLVRSLWYGGASDTVVPSIEGAGLPPSPAAEARDRRPGLAGQGPEPTDAAPLPAREAMVVLRDVFDEQTLEGLSLVVATVDGSSRQLRPSDPAGRVAAPVPLSLEGLSVDPPSWRVAGWQEAPAAGLAAVLWLCSHGVVRVHVASDPPLDAEQVAAVRVELVRGDARGATLDDFLLPPTGSLWLSRSRLDDRFPCKREPPDGLVHSARVPRQRWMVATALLDGFRCEPAPIEWGAARARSGDDAAEVFLRLSPAPVLSGVVRRADGSAVVGARVRVQVLSIVPRDQMDWAVHASRPAAKTYARRGDSAYTTLVMGDKTDAQGRYRIQLPADGEVLLAVHAAGCTPYRDVLGRVAASTARDVELVPSGRGRVLVTRAGKPVGAGTAFLTDLTDEVRQVLIECPVAADGTVAGDWLVPGRSYDVRVRTPGSAGPGGGLVRWSGERQLELEGLRSDLSEFRASLR